MTAPYYQDDTVELYFGDCADIASRLSQDTLDIEGVA